MVQSKRSPERDQIDRIAELAEKYGIVWHHCRDSRHCEGHPGMPDLILVGRQSVLMPELKSTASIQTPGQVRWAWQLRGLSPIWRPSDFRSGLVERSMQLIATGATPSARRSGSVSDPSATAPG